MHGQTDGELNDPGHRAMNSRFPTDNTIRQYLLGRLDEQKELEVGLSQQMLFSDELSEIVDSIEDEIIEDFLDGTLNTADQKAVEGYFLRPVERKKKLQLARLLREHFETKHHVQSATDRNTLPELAPIAKDGDGAHWLTLHFRSHLRSYCEFAALVLLSVSALIYMANIRHGLQSQLETRRKTQTQLEAELAQEREHRASLAKRLQELQPPVAALTFFGTFRAKGGTQEVEIRPYTERVKVEINLQSAAAKDFDVRLENQAGQQIWSQTGLQPSPDCLRFEMPAQGLTAGNYRITVSLQPAHTEKAYWFRAKIVK